MRRGRGGYRGGGGSGSNATGGGGAYTPHYNQQHPQQNYRGGGGRRGGHGGYGYFNNNHHNYQQQPGVVPYIPNPQQQQQQQPFQQQSHQYHNNQSGGGGRSGGQGQVQAGTPGGGAGLLPTPAVPPQQQQPQPPPIVVPPPPVGDNPPVETVVARLETATKLLHGISGDGIRVPEITNEINVLSEDLRRVGRAFENTYPDVLDRLMSSLRDASAQECLPASLRLAIFELVELRAAKWTLPSDISNYYRQRRNLNGQAPSNDEEGEIGALVGSGVLSKELKSNESGQDNLSSRSNETGNDSPPPAPAEPAKSYREEILIKNVDSGKVMGVRGRRVHIIEAISDTVISFEKVGAAAKERTLSINGYSPQSIGLAKQLIQETIVRNKSPEFDGPVLSQGSGESNGLRDFNTGQDHIPCMINGGSTSTLDGESTCSQPSYHYSVLLGPEVIKISGKNFQLVQEAKVALDEYFLKKCPELFGLPSLTETEDTMEQSDPSGSDVDPDETSGTTRRMYDREALVNLSRFGSATQEPDFSGLDQRLRDFIVLPRGRSFDPVGWLKRRGNQSTSTICELVPE